MATNNPFPMRSANPTLSSETFTHTTAARGAGVPAMTLEGTVNKTALSLLILLATATYTWNLASAGSGGRIRRGMPARVGPMPYSWASSWT